jgi:hypothetical protein
VRLEVSERERGVSDAAAVSVGDDVVDDLPQGEDWEQGVV